LALIPCQTIRNDTLQRFGFVDCAVFQCIQLLDRSPFWNYQPVHRCSKQSSEVVINVGFCLNSTPDNDHHHKSWRKRFTRCNTHATENGIRKHRYVKRDVKKSSNNFLSVNELRAIWFWGKTGGCMRPICKHSVFVDCRQSATILVQAWAGEFTERQCTLLAAAVNKSNPSNYGTL